MKEVISYKEKQQMNVLNISLNSHDFVTLENNDLYFWKNEGNTYFFKFKISLTDFEKVMEFMDLYNKLSDRDYYALPANLEMTYCLVPNKYYGYYYRMKTFCSHVLLGTDDELYSCKFYLPVNSELWRTTIKQSQNIIDIKIYVNGKLSNQPLSYDTAKRLGLIE